ncbi:hypothetical protein ROZALSC1DRAFT_21850 [Rozella allomycis CSF55]|uniref:Uncharacterized protein n=1 Tax=Rozella allomycis (strain CSF55) TaxID=988480 RepID=A0A4P9YKF8_ROZAC|nr:hypothetical protein ROZALSC1DRAFT_21850 [Rozella allomycis CSF55]
MNSCSEDDSESLPDIGKLHEKYISNPKKKLKQDPFDLPETFSPVRQPRKIKTKKAEFIADLGEENIMEESPIMLGSAVLAPSKSVKDSYEVNFISEYKPLQKAYRIWNPIRSESSLVSIDKVFEPTEDNLRKKKIVPFTSVFGKQSRPYLQNEVEKHIHYLQDLSSGKLNKAASLTLYHTTNDSCAHRGPYTPEDFDYIYRLVSTYAADFSPSIEFTHRVLFPEVMIKLAYNDMQYVSLEECERMILHNIPPVHEEDIWSQNDDKIQGISRRKSNHSVLHFLKAIRSHSPYLIEYQITQIYATKELIFA